MGEKPLVFWVCFPRRQHQHTAFLKVCGTKWIVDSHHWMNSSDCDASTMPIWCKACTTSSILTGGNALGFCFFFFFMSFTLTNSPTPAPLSASDSSSSPPSACSVASSSLLLMQPHIPHALDATERNVHLAKNMRFANKRKGLQGHAREVMPMWSP